MILHYMNLERNISIQQWFSQQIGFVICKTIKIILKFLPFLIVRTVWVILIKRGVVVIDLVLNGPPISAVEGGGRPDVEEDHGITWTEVVLDRPFDCICTLVGKVHGYGNPAVGCGGGGERRGADAEGGEWWNWEVRFRLVWLF
jgi:hypothetical protein